MSLTKHMAVIGLALALVASASAQPTRKQGKRPRRDASPAIGQVAPDFELVRLDAVIKAARDKAAARDEKPPQTQPKEQQEPKSDTLPKVRLSSFRGKRPVVLIFASYT